MSFIPVDNSAGILHNGGQMDWDAVSPGHIVMATITTDYKLLVQEINFNSGATVIGVPSFVKQLSGFSGDVTLLHLRPRIFSLGDGKILVMAPSTYTYNNLGNQSTAQYFVGTATSATRAAGFATSHYAPDVYSFISMQRDASGNYKITGSIDLSTTANTSAFYASTFAPIDLYTITPTQLTFRRPMLYASTTSGGSTGYFMYVQLSVLDGVVTGGTAGISNTSSVDPSYCLYDIRKKYTKSGKPIKLYTTGPKAVTRYAANGIGFVATEYYGGPVPANCVASRQNASINGLSYPGLVWLDGKSVAAISDDGLNRFAIGGNAAGANQTVDNNASSAGEVLFTPLDTAWVSDSVICIAGARTSTGGPVFESDVTAAIRANAYGARYRLTLSFREIAGAGTYVNPNDNQATSYYYEQYKNWNNVIHKIDNSHFWMIGCFAPDATADSKIGVITVSL